MAPFGPPEPTLEVEAVPEPAPEAEAVAEPEAAPAPEVAPEPEAAPDTDDFAGLEAYDLLNMIMELPPKYRMVFNLYAIEGYSHKEIGEMLGISEGTSKSNLSRAREILQKKVMILTGVTKRMVNV